MRLRSMTAPLAGVALALCAAAVVAQIEGGGGGVAPVDSGASFEVSGVTVDVAAKTADQARMGGWRLAQRKAWTQLSTRLTGSATTVPDSTLDTLVSGIVVEREQIAPTRYIAKLGVLFDRGRAGSLLGVSSYSARSAPMLLIPVQWSGGVGQTFETPSEWQQAWARFRTGNTSVDYVRPAGTGPDSLLLNVGQTGRPGRGWWRSILNEYGSSDVLIPTVKLYRQWPGGPVIGVFQARHGPDNHLLGSFSLRVGSAAGLPQLLDAGVKRIDDLYQTALRTGDLRPDASLSPPPAPPPPVTEATPASDSLDDGAAGTAPSGAAQSSVIIQFDTPNAGVVSSTEAAVRGVPGVRSAQTTSLALGGVSLMRVIVGGDPDQFRSALEARGYQVIGSGQTLRIRRAPLLLPPDIAPDDAPTG
jgi:hypothetical protein